MKTIKFKFLNRYTTTIIIMFVIIGIIMSSLITKKEVNALSDTITGECYVKMIKFGLFTGNPTEFEVIMPDGKVIRGFCIDHNLAVRQDGYYKFTGKINDSGTYDITVESGGIAPWSEVHDKQKPYVIPSNIGKPHLTQRVGGFTWMPVVPGHINLEKQSNNRSLTDGNRCYSLEGAIYGIYSDENATIQIDTIKTDTKGKARSKDLEPGKKYYVKEITPSKGYKLDDKVYSVYVSDGAEVKVVSEESPKYDLGIEITKLWTGEKTSTMLGLEGTEFTVKYYDGFYNEDNLPEHPTRSWVLEVKKIGEIYCTGLSDKHKIAGDILYTDSEGKAILPLGTVSIQETKPAFGYTLNGILKDSTGREISTREKYITYIKSDQDYINLNGLKKFSASNVPDLCGIEIKKLKEDNKSPIMGAKFMVKNSKGEIVKTVETGSDGIARLDNIYPDQYTITEIKTKTGYQLLSKPIIINLPSKYSKTELEKLSLDIKDAKYNNGRYGDSMYYVNKIMLTVVNTKILKAPSTGGVGRFNYEYIGILLILFSCYVAYIQIKKGGKNK
ncbi:collagen binding domain-containing protein [Eubacteriales bacterium KG127]